MFGGELSAGELTAPELPGREELMLDGVAGEPSRAGVVVLAGEVLDGELLDGEVLEGELLAGELLDGDLLAPGLDVVLEGLLGVVTGDEGFDPGAAPGVVGPTGLLTAVRGEVGTPVMGKKGDPDVTVGDVGAGGDAA